MLSKNQILDIEKQEGKKMLELRRQYNASLMGGARSYPMVSYARAHSFEAEAKSLGVSKVARARGGFMRVYQNNPSAAQLKKIMYGNITWFQRRNNFVTRHLRQYNKKKTLRRWLALMMWAYHAGPKPKGKNPKSKRRLSGGACWPGYERVPGTTEGAKGSCRKIGGRDKKKRRGGSSKKRKKRKKKS